MYRAIEAIYENGKLKFLENIGNIKKARVMVVFLDKKEDEELKRGNIAESPSIEFTKEAIGKFNRQFEDVEKRMENDDIDLLNDAFFSLEPIDMGYTSANMLDSIIANDGITEREQAYMEKIFVDTSFLIAYHNRKDENHEKAALWAKNIRKKRISFVISDYIFDEVLTVLLVRGAKDFINSAPKHFSALLMSR